MCTMKYIIHWKTKEMKEFHLHSVNINVEFYILYFTCFVLGSNPLKTIAEILEDFYRIKKYIGRSFSVNSFACIISHWLMGISPHQF